MVMRFTISLQFHRTAKGMVTKKYRDHLEIGLQGRTLLEQLLPSFGFLVACRHDLPQEIDGLSGDCYMSRVYAQ